MAEGKQGIDVFIISSLVEKGFSIEEIRNTWGPAVNVTFIEFKKEYKLYLHYTLSSPETGIPLTPFLNEFADGAGGHWFTSYGATPSFLSSRNRALMLFNHEIVVFDFRPSQYAEIELLSVDLADPARSGRGRGALHIAGRLIAGQTPLEMVSEMSLVSGRQRPLPSWALDGAILGVEGGQVFGR